MKADVRRAAASQPIYASFGLDDEEYAVDVRHVREVVNLPSSLMMMPLSPDFVAGVFNLRGAIIPVLNAKRLLRTHQAAQQAGSKIVVVDHGGTRLGLIIDATGRVLRPRGEEQTLFGFGDGSTHSVVAGVLKIGSSLVRVLDLERLMALENVPYPQDGSRSGYASRAKARRRKCITFHVGGMQLGFAIDGIQQIMLATGIERSPIQESLCAGVIHIGDEVVPVVRFSTLLQVDAATDANTADARVITLEIGQARVGLLVDAVESIDSYLDEDLMHVPMLTRHKANMFAGCLDFGERGHVFLLSSQGVMDNDELSRVTGNYSQLFGAGEHAAWAAQRRAESRQSFLWFKARDAFALPMREAREIIDGTSGLITMPGAPEFVAGMFNLRGELVTVVDVRAFYHLGAEPGETPRHRKIVVLDHPELLLGLLVDSVESILHVAPADKIPVPTLLRNAMPPAVREDVREIIQAGEQSERAVHILVLDAERVIAAIAAQGADVTDA